MSLEADSAANEDIGNAGDDSGQTTPAAFTAVESSDHHEQKRLASPTIAETSTGGKVGISNSAHGESLMTPRRFRGQTIVAQASSTSKLSTLADDNDYYHRAALAMAAAGAQQQQHQQHAVRAAGHKVKTSVDNRQNFYHEYYSNSNSNVDAASSPSSSADGTRRDDDGSGGGSGGSSLDSLLELNEAAEEGIPMQRLFGSASGRGEYRPLGGGGNPPQRHSGTEPIWSRRMLVLPLVMLAGMALAAAAISTVAWVREKHAHPTERVDAAAFPFGVARAQVADGQHAVRLVHTNDMHARFVPHDAATGAPCDPEMLLAANQNSSCVGGAAYVKALIDHLRGGAGVDGAIVLNAGDELQGSVFSALFRGNMSADLLNAVAPDALALGNHEFDRGPHHLARFLARVAAPAVCANIEFAAQDLPDLQAALQPFTVVDRHAVGVVGVLTPETQRSSSVGDSVRITDAAAAVNRARRRLAAMGVTRVVVLSHLGYPQDQDLAKSIEPGVALIVGAHTHTYLAASGDNASSDESSGGAYPTWVANAADREWQTAVVQAASFGHYVGFLDLVFNADGSLDSRLTTGRPVRVDVVSPSSPIHAMKPSARALEIMQPYLDRAAELSAVVVGRTAAVFPPPASNRDPRALELGALVADALVWSSKAHTPVALLGSGALRAPLPLGDVTRGALLEALPFDDSVLALKLPGKALRAAIAASISAENNTASLVLSTLQVSGLRWKNRDEDSAEIRTDITSTSSDSRPVPADSQRWAPLDDNASYEVLAPRFLAVGGDNLIDPASVAASRIVSDSLRTIVELYVARFSPLKHILE
ncbi:hypothetical protein EV177_003663 [Coemansia sp. RSA 1804]|nr:hypothetical protein EV177_003663 [Coemansia sp. RSA 1804]